MGKYKMIQSRADEIAAFILIGLGLLQVFYFCVGFGMGLAESFMGL